MEWFATYTAQRKQMCTSPRFDETGSQWREWPNLRSERGVVKGVAKGGMKATVLS